MGYGGQVLSPTQQRMVDVFAPIYYLDYFQISGTGSRTYQLEEGLSLGFYIMETMNGWAEEIKVSGNTVSWKDARGSINIMVYQK